MSRQTPYFAFGGGLDLVTPPIQMPDGRMIAGNNYEPWINGGYRRVRGYERFDGRPAPSEATWIRLLLNAIGALAVGNTVTGDTSTATGVIAAIAGNYIAVTKVVGTFAVAETLNTAVATVVEVSTSEDAETIEQEEVFLLAAESIYRTDIQQVPGLGPVRGAWQCKDRVYAIRDNAGLTAGIIHKATASGWSAAELTMTRTITFSTGSSQPAIGATLTGATSAATGVIHKIVVHNGNWGTSDASGYFVLTGVTGTFVSAENLQTASVTRAVSTSGATVFALPVGGRYSFVTENFLAGSLTYRAYCAGGVGPAFEIDEDDIVSPILLDLTMGDAPEENDPYLVEVFDGKLWMAFPGGSLQCSIAGDPLTFNGFLGAAEFGLGDEITGLVSIPGPVLVAYTRNQTHAFQISDTSYFKRLISERSGAILYSIGELSTSYAIDDSGIVSLQRVDAFGDFADSTVSDLIQPVINGNKHRIAGVMMVRESNQYRVLFTDGNGVIARMRPDGIAEFGTFSMGTTVHCAYWCEDLTGAPTYYFAGSSGYVYRAERGRNFDGNEIESFCRLPFNHQSQPAIRKRYRLAEIELRAQRALRLRAAQDLSYASQETSTHTWDDSVIGGGGFYDLDNWDEIYWDAQTFTEARFELLGTGKNISLLFYHKSAAVEPFILQGCTLHYDPRRVSR